VSVELSTDLERALLESWTGSRLVDPRQPYYDTPGFGWLSRKMGLYTHMDYRSHGRFAPIYDNELDLRAIRMASWLMDAEVPVARGMKNRRTDYTISSGFDWKVTHENEKLGEKLADAIDGVLMDIDWPELEIESFEREQVDGEFIGVWHESEGDWGLEVLEGDALTEPMGSGIQQELNDWKGYDFATSWSFGVLTEETQVKPKAYHIVRNVAGTDFDVVEPDRFVHWKRNVSRNAKRGAPDSFTPHKWLRHGEKVGDRTAVGTAIQASIAYIVEHAASTSATQASRLAAARSNQVVRHNPVTGGQYRQRTVEAGEVIDIKNGQKYHSSLLGSNASTIYLDVMTSCFRLCGVIDAFPEHMVTGYAGNNNRASSETAESPFIQGRLRNQRNRSRRMKRMLIQLIKLLSESSDAFPSWEEIEPGLSISVDPPNIISRDEAALTDVMLKQIGAGLQSKQGASNLLNIDYEETQEQIVKEQQEAIEREQEELGRVGFQGERQPPTGPDDGADGEAGSGAVPPPGAPDGDSGAADDGAADGNVSIGEAVDLTESFDPMKHPRGKDGKFVYSGVKMGHWKKTNSSAKWAKKKIRAMEGLAAEGKWSEISALYTHPISKKTGQPVEKLNQFQKGVLEAKSNLLKLKDADLAPPAGSKPSKAMPGAVTSKGWVKTGSQLGSNPGGKYKGPDGKEYYVKQPADPGHARAEVLTAKLYKAAGAGVVDADLVDIDGKTSIATRWLDGSSKIKWTEGDKKLAQEDFMVHAWLGNWDCIGHPSEMDNIRMHKGEFVAVDVGGSLNYRAQGGKKAFTAEVSELNTLRDAKVNPSAAKVFGNMTNLEIAEAAKKLEGVTNKQINEIVNSTYAHNLAEAGAMRQVLKARKAALIKAAQEMTPSVNKLDSVISPKQEINLGKAFEAAAAKGAVKPAPPKIPAKVIVTSASNQGYQKHFDALHDLAVKGDAAGLAAYKTNSTSKQTYVKQLHQHKLALMDAIGLGASEIAQADAVTKKVASAAKTAAKSKPKKAKPTVANFKPKASEFPALPKFLDAKFAKQNEEMGGKMLELAKAGKIAELEATLPKSPKLTQFKQTLVDGLKDQLNQHLASASGGKVKAYKASAVVAEASKIKINPQAKQKIGYWVVHGRVETPAPPPPAMAFKEKFVVNGKQGFFSKGKNQLYQNATSAEAENVEYYTGAGHSYMNGELRAGGKISSETQLAINGLKKSVHSLPADQTYSRKYAMYDESSLAALAKMEPGTVIADPAILSTSTDPDVWTGNVKLHFDAAPGSKGLAADSFSKNNGEMEVILKPNSRFVVHRVDRNGSSVKIRATLLPDMDD
jgi:hypothetical protein